MAIYKVGRIYRYDFTWLGRRYKASTKQTSRTLAKQIESDLRRDLREGRATVVDISFGDLAEKYTKLHVATKRCPSFFESTIKVLLRHFAADRMVSSITPGDVDAFRAARLAAVGSTATANRTFTVFKHMLRLAVRWRHLAQSPAVDLKLEREPKHRERFLTTEEAVALTDACPEWLRRVVVAALHMGARRGELLALDWKDVDLTLGRATFRQTKNGEPRTVALTASLLAMLKDMKPRFQDEGRVFLNFGGTPIHADGLTWSFRLAAKKAGLVGLRFHDLRHSAASFLVQAGIPLNTVREILGHKSLAMTLRYAHLAPAHQAEAVKALESVGRAAVPLQAVVGRNDRQGDAQSRTHTQ